MPIKKFNSVYGFSVGDDLQQEVVDSNANVTANVLTVTSTSNLGSNSNVKITGGSSGQVLKTDGLGNLYWALDSAPAGGANTQIQFNNNGSLDGNSGFTYNYVTGLLSLSGNISTGNAGLGNLVTANYFSGDGRLLTNVSAVTSITAGTVTTNAQPNITSVGTLNGLTVTGTATFQNILVDGSTANFNVNTLTIKDGLIDLLNGTIGTPSQNAGLRVMRGDELAVQLRWNEASQVWQYTVDGVTYRNLVGVDSAGNVNLSNIGVANYFYGNGYYLTGISSASIIGQVANALVAGTVYTNAQPNITSVGTLSSLNVTGNVSTSANITSGNASLGNLATASYFSGDGSLLTNINSGNITGQVANALVAGTVYNPQQPNITSVGTLSSLSVTSNISTGNILGNGYYLSGINSSNIVGQVANALIAGTVYNPNQPNITSVGTLSSLTVTSDTTIGGNLIVNGTTTYINVDTLNIEDPVIALGGGPNGNALTVNDGKDRGSLLHYYTTKPIDAFMGWDNSNAEFAFGSNVSVTGDIVTFNDFGNIRAGYFIGNGSQLTGVSADTAITAGTVTTNAQPNITSVGTLTNLNVSGNVSAGNVLGNGYYLSGLNGSNVLGQVANSLVAGTVYTNAQPNITSVGTLTTLNTSGNITSGGNLLVTANVSAGNANLGTLATATYFSGDGSNLTSITGGNVTGQVSNALVAGTVYNPSQPNITSVGSLASLNVTSNITSGGNVIVTANISSGNANLGTLATATYFSGDGSNLTNITGANVTGQVGNSLIAGTVYTNAQPNITSLGTLSTLNVTGNITSGGNLSVTSNISSGNANLGTLATATYFSGDGSNLTNLPAGTQIVNGTSNLRVFNNGNIALSVSGTSNVVTVTSSNVNVTGNVAVSNLLSRDGKNVPTFVSQTDTPTNPKLGDQWYDTDNDVIYQYIYDGVSYTWVDTSSGYITSDVSATGNTLVQRDANANVNANYFVGNGATLGNLANVRITGGTASYVIQTDGAGNLSWVNPTTFTTTPAGSNTQLQFNDGGSFGGSDNLTFNKATNTFTTFNALINGNLTVNGTTEYTNVNNLYVQDPIIEMGGNANGGPLTSNDGKDRGTLLHYYTTKTVDAFMGWDNSNAEFAFGSNVTVSNEVVTYNTFGNVRAGNFLGNGYYLSNIFGSNVVGQVANASVAGTVYSNAQPNITSVGTLTSLTVSGNTSSGNVLGNGYYLSGLFGSNVIGQVANALVAGTVYNPAQPNITSVGTLTSLTVSGNISSGNVLGTHYGNGYNLFGIYGSNVIGQVANALVAGTVYNPAQPNITSVGTLTSLNVSGNVSSGGSVIGTHYGNGYNLYGIFGSNVIGQVSNALVAGTVYNSSQPNITSVGTLTNLTVTSNVSAGNILGNGYYLSSIVGGNVSGQVSNALVAGTVYNPSQPNITSTGTLNGLTATGTVNFTGASNVSLGSNANVKISGGSAGYVLKTDGAGNLSWGIDTTAAGGSNTQIQFNDNGTLSATSDFTFDKTTKVVNLNGSINTANLTSTGLVNFTSASNVALGANSTVKITGGSSGQVLSTDGAGNLAWTSAASAAAIYVQSNIDSIVAGSALTFVTDYTNPSYPGGVFTLAQLGPVTGALTDVWTSSGTSTKNAYANFEAGTVLNSNINVTFTLSNATFNIQSTDTITIGSTTITGANITGLGISGTGGTYTIANTLFATSVLTNSTSTVTANLTTNRGFKTYTGTTLNATQPVRFNVNSLSGSFGTNPAPYWTTTQTFNWSASLTAGASVISGNVTYSNTAQSISGTLTSSGATSGTSPSLNCALTYTISSSDYTGSGANGAGARVIPSTVNGTVNAVTFYYPLFYKTTSSSANPNFTTSDAYNANNFTTGQGANTTANPTDYLWIATPTTTARSWAYTFVGSRVDVTPDVTYTNQTISGQTYTVYGFTNYSAITFIYTV